MQKDTCKKTLQLDPSNFIDHCKKSANIKCSILVINGCLRLSDDTNLKFVLPVTLNFLINCVLIIIQKDTEKG